MATTDNDTLTVAEAASKLGVTTMTVRRWIQDGRLPGTRIPGARAYRVRRADVEAAVSNSQVVPRGDATDAKEGGMHQLDSVQMFLDVESSDAT
jgi:excisionase family DNA binding protein